MIYILAATFVGKKKEERSNKQKAQLVQSQNTKVAQDVLLTRTGTVNGQEKKNKLAAN